MKIRELTFGIFAALALTACTTDDISNQQTTGDGTLRFAPEIVSDWNAPWTTRAKAEAGTTVQSLQGADGLYMHTIVSQGIKRKKVGSLTRGTKYTGIDDGHGNKTFPTTKTFYVSGYRYANSETVGNVNSANFLNNATVSYDNEWKATQNYVMPATTDKIDFFAWFVDDETTAGVTPIDAKGGLQITYTVPTDIDNQPDLLTAAAREEVFDATPGHTVDLTFAHQLTAVNFVLDDNVAPGTITEIAFMNVYTGGTLSIGEGISGTWSLTNAPTETAYSMDFPTVDTGGELRIGETLIANLMMIPQTFSETQRIRITMTIDGMSRYLYADLKDTRWEPSSTVTYKISTSAVNVLRVSGVTYPTSWSTASTENSDIKSTYANGDEIGVYAVDPEGNVVYANKKYTLTSGNWVSEDVTQSLYIPGCTYYAYYPYQSSGLTSAPEVNTSVLVNSALPTAAQFFAEAVTNWTPAANQSTAAALNLQDLQIGQSTTGAVSTVSFTMAHAMGLTSLTLAQGTIPETRFFIINSSGNETSSYVDSNETVTVTASTDFTNPDIEDINTKMLINGRKYYYVVNPQKETITVTGPAEGEERWVTPNVVLEVTAGTFQNINVNHPKAYYYKGWLYEYRGNYQTFTASTSGTYRIECWGASGTKGDETDPEKAAHGGYCRGDIALTANQALYVYAGEEGGFGDSGGFRWYWNGGGYAQQGGGGASDVRITSGSWNNATSLRSRIIVAGAGGGGFLSGGSGIVDNRSPGDGGGLNGYDASCRHRNSQVSGTNSWYLGGHGGTQTDGGAGGTMVGDYDANNSTKKGGFGWGGYSHVIGGTAYVSSSGGGGWYGGGHGIHPGNAHTGGGGGSSYISGHAGCVGVTSTGAQQSGDDNTRAKSLSHTGFSFIEGTTKMIDGRGYEWTTAKGSAIVQIPKPTGNGMETGHLGNGYVRISARFLIDD